MHHDTSVSPVLRLLKPARSPGNRRARPAVPRFSARPGPAWAHCAGSGEREAPISEHISTSGRPSRQGIVPAVENGLRTFALALGVSFLAALSDVQVASAQTGSHELTVQREWLEELILDNTQNRLKALSDEELLSLFKDVVKAKPPAVLESEATPAAGVLSRLAPFSVQRPSTQQQQLPGASEAVTGTAPGSPAVLEEDRQRLDSLSKSRGGGDGAASPAQPELSSESDEDATARLLQSSGVELPREQPATAEASTKGGLLKSAAQLSASLAGAAAGALSAAAPVLSLAGLGGVVFFFVRLLNEDEDEDGDEDDGAAKEKAAAPSNKAPPTTPQEAKGQEGSSGKAKLALRPLAEVPQAIRKLPALALLSRLVKSEPEESSPSAHQSVSAAAPPQPPPVRMTQGSMAPRSATAAAFGSQTVSGPAPRLPQRQPAVGPFNSPAEAGQVLWRRGEPPRQPSRVVQSTPAGSARQPGFPTQQPPQQEGSSGGILWRRRGVQPPQTRAPRNTPPGGGSQSASAAAVSQLPPLGSPEAVGGPTSLASQSQTVRQNPAAAATVAGLPMTQPSSQAAAARAAPSERLAATGDRYSALVVQPSAEAAAEAAHVAAAAPDRAEKLTRTAPLQQQESKLRWPPQSSDDSAAASTAANESSSGNGSPDASPAMLETSGAKLSPTPVPLVSAKEASGFESGTRGVAQGDSEQRREPLAVSTKPAVPGLVPSGGGGSEAAANEGWGYDWVPSSWLEAGSEGEDENCFPRQQDREAYRTKRVRRHRVSGSLLGGL